MSSEYNIIPTTELNYIALTANINNAIITDESGRYYGLVGGSFNNERANEFNAFYNLPSGSVTFPIGNINTILPDNSSGESFIPIITLAVNKEGNLSASVNITGDDVNASVAEDVNKAQVVSWSTQPSPSINSTSPDILNATISNTDVFEYLFDTVQSIKDAYSYNVISSWNMEITPVTAQENSIITQYAINNNNRTIPNIFNDGEQIVLNTTYPYSVDITNLEGNREILVPNTEIYAIVTHSDSAPPLL
jgi:hypothetical protein